MSTVLSMIEHLRPCEEAETWLAGYTDADLAWQECPDGSWMLWLLGHLSGDPESEDRKKLVLCCCECARLSLPHTKDARVLACIETAEKWANGKATIEELRTARSLAAGAAYAAGFSAYAATYSAYSAYAAAAAAAAARGAAAYAAAYATKKQALSACADIVRQHYPHPPKIEPPTPATP